jgi:hypothetical protein
MLLGLLEATPGSTRENSGPAGVVLPQAKSPLIMMMLTAFFIYYILLQICFAVCRA